MPYQGSTKTKPEYEPNPPERPVPPEPPSPYLNCKDSSLGLEDKYGDGCDWYEGRFNSCGRYDTEEFIASDMCCGCGAGRIDQLPNEISKSCSDTDNGALDRFGWTCVNYYNNESWCEDKEGED